MSILGGSLLCRPRCGCELAADRHTAAPEHSGHQPTPSGPATRAGLGLVSVLPGAAFGAGHVRVAGAQLRGPMAQGEGTDRSVLCSSAAAAELMAHHGLCAHSRAPAESCSVLRAPGSVPRAVHSHRDPAAYWGGAQQSLTLGCVQAPQKQNLMGRAPCPYPKPSKLRWDLHSFSLWFHSWVPVGGFCPPQQAQGHPCTAQPCPGSLALRKADVPLLAGPCPVETSGTRSHFTLTDCPEEGTWSAVLQQQDGATLCVSLCSPSSARVGRYRLTLEASTGYQGSSFHLGDFVLLFNAWHPGEALTFPTPERSQGSFPCL